MKIITKETLEMTAPLEQYIDEKLMPLSKFVEPYERDGEVELRLEISRTTQHHRKGDEIFMAAIDLALPGKVLRSEASASDIRKAIDDVRNMIHMEIQKYKTKNARPQEREK